MRASTVTIKTEQDLEKLRVSGRLAAQVLEMIGEYVKPGVTTEYLDNICNDYIVNTLKVIPAYVLQSMKWYVMVFLLKIKF